MKNFVLITSIFLTSFSISAQEDSFCKNIQGLYEIKNYVACQAGQNLASCAALYSGVFTAGAGTNFLFSEYMKDEHLKDFLARKKSMVTDIKESLKAGWQAGLEDYRQRVGNEYDALPGEKTERGKKRYVQKHVNAFMENQPPSFAKDAQTIVDSLEQELRTTGKIDVGSQKNIEEMLYKSTLKEKYGFVPKSYEPLSSLPLERQKSYESLARFAIDHFRLNVEKHGFASVILKASMQGPRSAAIKGGLISVAALAVANGFTNSKATYRELGESVLQDLLFVGSVGCAGKSDHLMNLDGNCRPLYQVDGNVFRFLQMNEEDQKKALKDPTVCKYFKDIRDRLAKQPNYMMLSCNGSQFSVVAKMDGESRNFNVRLDANQKIRTIVSSLAGTNRYSYNLENESKPEDEIYPPRKAEEYLLMKKFIVDAKNCCLSPNQQCLSRFNSDQGKPSTSNHAPSSGER